MQKSKIYSKASPVIKGRKPHQLGLKYVYSFEEGDARDKNLLGGKGAALCKMTQIGLPVPQGFIVTTEACHCFAVNNSYPADFFEQFDENLKKLERKTGKVFGDAQNPLLVSVRSGAAVSMPGMMDTVLNLGLNDETIKGLINTTKDERFAYDSYRRFINMFGNVVMGIPHEIFEHEMDKIKKQKNAKLDTELSAGDLKNLTAAYKKAAAKYAKKPFPESPKEQLKLSLEAVFRSWNNERAKTYRKINKITGLLGTAVNIQSMVFGNMGADSGTGVVFTRNPSTGEKELYGEFLMNAQGEDVVAGIRTPQEIAELNKIAPGIYAQFAKITQILEEHYKDMQDIEFTIEKGKLFILQTRNGKRGGRAAIKIALDFVKEGLLTKKEALLKVNPESLNHLLHPSIDPRAAKTVIAKGLAASPGAATGKAVFTAEDAVAWTENNEAVILVRKETCPEDIHGMHSAKGILTSVGGLTSHAALVCRGMGKPCVVGASNIYVDVKKKVFITEKHAIKEGDIITIDGTAGEIMLGAVPAKMPEVSGDFKKFMEWADKVRVLKVRANADTPKDALAGRNFGAEGIGLCRTEHMFFEKDRIPKIREMIVAQDKKGRRKALTRLKPLQKKDFLEIFKAMDGLPVTIRLLDPPLHEFLPENPQKVEDLAKQMKISPEKLQSIISKLHEINPMLGHRGVRLGITHPEIYEMQTEAIIEAAIESSKKKIKVIPEIEIPLVGDSNELLKMRGLIENVAARYEKEINFEIRIGTMIELPRACVTADEIAKSADFFSFGTNDLTQMTFGFSRDDAGKFLPQYMEQKILERDPTDTIDREGVGELMKMAVNFGKNVKPDLEIGICGEHGGEPQSVEFCHEIGLNYVSCSPFRVPIARLAAAQAQIRYPRQI